jgi:hypothetical protein
MEPEADLVWYVAYGSNLASERLRCYLAGGRPHGGHRTYAGARDPRDPHQTRAVELPGGIVFAGQSTVWEGGIAFYAPRASGQVAARAYLLTVEQVNDLVAQEIRRPPGGDLGLVADRPNSSRPLGGRAYDTALRLEDIDGHPAVTITANHSPKQTSPSAAYLLWICRGLVEAFDWPPARIARYLGQFPGIRDTWTRVDLVALANLANLASADPAVTGKY